MGAYLDGGEGGDDTGVVGDGLLAVLGEGDVEVAADEDALALDVVVLDVIGNAELVDVVGYGGGHGYVRDRRCTMGRIGGIFQKENEIDRYAVVKFQNFFGMTESPTDHSSSPLPLPIGRHKDQGDAPSPAPLPFANCENATLVTPLTNRTTSLCILF